MLKKLTLLAMAIAAISALVAPAFASAADEWTKNGGTLASDATVHFEGSAKFESETLGAVTCASKATAVADIKAGTNSATITQFTDSAPTTDCTVDDFLGAVCGEHSLTNVELTKNEKGETIHASGTGTSATGVVHITGVQLLNQFGTCLTLVLTGNVSATFDSTTAATKATLSGELETGGFGNVKVGGTLNITQSGEYGIKAF